MFIHLRSEALMSLCGEVKDIELVFMEEFLKTPESLLSTAIHHVCPHLHPDGGSAKYL